MPKKIGLALAGGGARGLAHIGVLRSLEERGYEPVGVAGCSMGSILGAFIAAGWDSRRIHQLVKGLKWRDLIDRGEHGALFGNDKIGRLLGEHLPEQFQDLSIPLHALTVDCQDGELVDFHEGELVPALLASSAIPGILSPIHHAGRWLLDGGLLNNLPVDVIRTITQEPVVAVDVGAPPNRNLDFDMPESLWERWTANLPSIRFDRKLGFYTENRGLTVELFLKIVDIPTALVTRLRLAMNPPEVLVAPDLAEDFGIEDFQRFEEAIERGYEAAEETLARAELERG